MLTNDSKDFVGLELTDSEVEDDEDDEDVKEAVTSVSEERQWVGVSDLAIGGRCKCNGHASECTMDRATGNYLKDILKFPFCF